LNREHGPVYCPKVLVYKSPGLHVGDVKVFEAVWLKELAEIIGNGKHAIFFSVQGPRSVVDEIANSDLDGDQYWCCTNPLVSNSSTFSSLIKLCMVLKGLQFLALYFRLSRTLCARKFGRIRGL
jgi:RNA-dependent RNA polymerase